MTTYAWTNGDSNRNLSDPANYSPAGGPPTSADTLNISGLGTSNLPNSGISYAGTVNVTGTTSTDQLGGTFNGVVNATTITLYSAIFNGKLILNANAFLAYNEVAVTGILALNGGLNVLCAVGAIVSNASVVSGVPTYPGGPNGTYPTTATSQAAQLATDLAAVNAAVASIESGVTIIGSNPGTYPLSATSYASGYAAGEVAGNAAGIISGEASQLAADVAIVQANASSFFPTTTILGVTGTFGQAPLTTSADAALALEQQLANVIALKLQTLQAIAGVIATGAGPNYTISGRAGSESVGWTGYLEYLKGQVVQFGELELELLQAIQDLKPWTIVARQRVRGMI